jgi:probable F420-dependent oxidoreductase
VNILNFGPGVGADAIGRWAQVAEALGYHSVMISDHLAMTPDVRERYPEPFYDPFVTLAWLAGRTTRVKLGTTVCVLPYRHPIVTARMAANIHNLSGGRFILGVGVGNVNAQLEYAALGVPFHQRGAIANEYLAAIRALWTQENATFQGKYVSFRDVSRMRTALDTGSPPPIWVGGASDAAIRRAVRFGDGWHPNRFSVAWLRDQGIPKLRRIAAEEDRPVPALCPRLRFRITDAPVTDPDRHAGTGTIEQVHEDFRQLEALGVQHVTLDWYTNDLELTRRHEWGWRQFAAMAEMVFDLPRETVR